MIDRAVSQHKNLAVNLQDVHLSLGTDVSRVHILKGVSLNVEKGTSLGLIGPSGSGKSSLLMVIAGLERANAGLVEIEGQSLANLSEDQLAQFRGRRVGIVFQSFHLIPNMTALENVAVPLELAGVRDAFLRAEEELVHVGLGERLQHYPSSLSGGEQQRVAIARALAPKPAILIADEPTGNLDAKTGEQIAKLIFDLQQNRGMTLILVTHDTVLAKRCTHKVAIRSGEVVEDSASSLTETQQQADQQNIA